MSGKDAGKRRSEDTQGPPGVKKRPKIDSDAMRAKIKARLSKLQLKKPAVGEAPPHPGRPPAEPHAQLPATVAAAPPPPPAPAVTAPPTGAKAKGEPTPTGPAEEPAVDTGFDPTLKTRRRKPGLNLFQIGSVPQEHRDAIAAARAPPPPIAATPSSSLPAIQTDIAPASVPAVEWWDALVLQDGYLPGPDGEVLIREDRITNLVEHPVPIEPPVMAPAPAPQPLKLTKREMKKMRRQRREEREKEKQLNIQLGLLEPAKPKVRLSNMARVYGADGVIDATAIEKKVREAQQERQAAHEDRNQARKLTTDERKAKKLKKMFDDAAADLAVQVYRVTKLTDARNLYKVEINATENRLTGMCVTTETGTNVVVVEGDRKGMRRFQRLMLHRIDWNPGAQEATDDDMFTELNKCHLVWQGQVVSAAFEDFKQRKCVGNAEGRMLFAEHGVAHYWDAAEKYVVPIDA